MTLSNLEKNAIKTKAIAYLEKSIYTLSLLLGLSPEVAMDATSVDELEPELSNFSEEAQQSFESLFNQIQALKSIS
jgi:hypothetical protein